MAQHQTAPKANVTWLRTLYPGPRREFNRAFGEARRDPLVVPVTRFADFSAPHIRAEQVTAASRGRCGGVQSIDELNAPLFMAAERPRKLSVEKAPFGLLMGGKTEQQMLSRIRQYQRNTSLPLRCHYATCAVVGSSGSLRGGRLGAQIDAHDAVIRINAAPVHGYEDAVGRRTTWRVHNSEKPFMMAASGLPELQVAICHMAWIGSCQHQAFSGAYLGTLAYVNPRFYSQIFDLIGRPKDKQTPSTGLLAIALALGTCDKVRIFGFGKTGATAGSGGARCRHYWECVRWEDEAKYHDPLHTFHDWQAEERLRELWLSARIIEQGGEATPLPQLPSARLRNGSASGGLAPAGAWRALRSRWHEDLAALRRARDSRRKRGIKAGEGEYVQSTSQLLQSHGGSGGGSGVADGNGGGDSGGGGARSQSRGATRRRRRAGTMRHARSASDDDGSAAGGKPHAEVSAVAAATTDTTRGETRGSSRAQPLREAMGRLRAAARRTWQKAWAQEEQTRPADFSAGKIPPPATAKARAALATESAPTGPGLKEDEEDVRAFSVKMPAQPFDLIAGR
jgi:hypothetical protein